MQPFPNQEISELRSRIDQIHALLANRADADDLTLGDAGSRTEAVPPSIVLVNQLSFSIQMRRLRKSHFGAHVSGPTWDMMLDLMLAESHDRTLSASDLATGAGVPLSSGLRMIAALEDRGLARRTIDERDRRRSIVRLTASGTERMASYFEKIGDALRSSRNLAA